MPQAARALRSGASAASIPASSNTVLVTIEREPLRRAGERHGPLPEGDRLRQRRAAPSPRLGGDPRRRAGEERLVARLRGLERERLGERRAPRIGRIALAHQLVQRRVEPVSSSPR